MKTRANARGGFTLVEVLLTLLIMAGIMLSLTQILTAARTSRDTIHNIQETQLAGPAILDMLERDLRGLTIYGRARADQLRVRSRVMLGMDGDSVDFVTTADSLVQQVLDDRIVRADWNEVGYRLRQSPDSDQFLEIYRREAFGVDDQPFEGGTFVLLHDRVKSFDVQSFAEDGPDEDPIAEWGTERNEEASGLPARIEITLVLELAPRLVNEQLRIAPIDRRTLTYKRVLRIPQILRSEEDAIPIPLVPKAPRPAAQTPGAATPPPAGGTPPPGGSGG